jgi:hypothetical protein
VAEAGITLGIALGIGEAGTTMFVGRGAGLVEGATDTDRSQAVVTSMSMKMDKRDLFRIVLFMAEFPFILKHTH